MVLIIVYKGVSAGAGRCHVVTGLQEIYRKAAGQYFFQFPSGFHSILAKLLYGENYEQLEGIFGLRIHVVRMKLGDEQIELTDYLTQGGSSIPEDKVMICIFSTLLLLSPTWIKLMNTFANICLCMFLQRLKHLPPVKKDCYFYLWQEVPL